MTKEQDFATAISARNSSAAWRELALVVAGVVGAFLLAAYFDVSEWWFEWVEAHEEWELDEVPMGLSLMSLGLAAYALRRWQESRAMARLLNRSNERLEAMVAERTATVEAQARDLERSLKAQIEYNTLHREFLSMASHEFRTPLTIIDGSAQRIIRRIGRIPPEELSERLGDIRSASARMIGLIESTLSAEQLEAGKIRIVLDAVDMTQLLTAVQGRQAEIAPSHQVDLDLQDLPDELRGDSKLLEQVFANLLSNAVKYSPDHERVEVTGRRDGDAVVVTVRDHGLGVPAAELPRLFQRYFRASTTIGIAGTGIGLHVVQKFVEMHDGSVRVESVEGEGTTFTVRLPIAGPREVESDTAENDAAPAPPAATAAA